MIFIKSINDIHIFLTEPSELDPTLEALNDENLDGLDGTDGALSALDGRLTEQTITPAVADTPVEEEKGKSELLFFTPIIILFLLQVARHTRTIIEKGERHLHKWLHDNTNSVHYSQYHYSLVDLNLSQVCWCSMCISFLDNDQHFICGQKKVLR